MVLHGRLRADRLLANALYSRHQWLTYLADCCFAAGQIHSVCLCVSQACGADSKAVAASDDRRLRLKVLSGHVRAALMSDNFSAALQGGLSCLACCSPGLQWCQLACVLRTVSNHQLPSSSCRGCGIIGPCGAWQSAPCCMGMAGRQLFLCIS